MRRRPFKHDAARGLRSRAELIRTVAGRGYQFNGEIRVQSVSSDELPESVSELIGRDDELTRLFRRLVATTPAEYRQAATLTSSLPAPRDPP